MAYPGNTIMPFFENSTPAIYTQTIAVPSETIGAYVDKNGKIHTFRTNYAYSGLTLDKHLRFF